MSTLVNNVLDFGGGNRITNLAAATANGQPVTYEQMNAAIEGLAWKDDVRVATGTNVTISSPGATLDGVTMANGDRVLLRAQTSQPENGIYIWNGAATPMTRALDANTFDELEAAITTVSEGTSAGTSYRQTQVNGVIGTNNVVWTTFGTSVPVASTSVSGTVTIATQAEVDTGTDTLKVVTPATLASYANRAKRYAATIGDGSATSIGVTHNLGTKDVEVYVYENSGSFRAVLCEIQHTSTNQVTLVFASAPASNAYRVVVIA